MPDICEIIENDDFFKTFLGVKNNDDNDDGGDTTTNDGTSSKADTNRKLLNNNKLSYAEQIIKLSEGLESITNELQSQVREQHGALLSQASHSTKLTIALDTVTAHMERLKCGADKLRQQVQQPFQQLEQQTRVLERLHDAAHLLRQIGKFLQIYRKLQQSIKNPIQQATLLYEFEMIIDDDDHNNVEQFDKIEFIREEKAHILQMRQLLNNLANRDLIDGLKNDNRDQVFKSLQIFSNLHILPKCIDNLLETFHSEIKHSIKECFAGTDVSSLSSRKPTGHQAGGAPPLIGTTIKKDIKSMSKGPGKQPNLSSTQHLRTKLWAALEWLFDEEIFGYCQQICLLQKTLSLIVQPNSFTIDQVQVMIGDTFTGSVDVNSYNIEQTFWQKLELLLTQSFTECAPHIAQCLQQNLPKLLSMARNLQVKFGTKFVFTDSVFKSLEVGYLEKCATNLKFTNAEQNYPNSDDIDNFIRIASSELSAAIVDQHLCLLVAGVFNACNKDFWTKIESQIKLGTDSSQVVDQLNSSQILNITLANIIHMHNESVRRMCANMGNTFVNSEAGRKILIELNYGQTLAITIIQQLIESINSTISIILLSMHREPGLNTDKLSVAGPSLYMKELMDFIQRVWQIHIQPFNDKQNISKYGAEVATRCVELFVRNLSIIRPISLAGRNRLKSDCQHLENALKPIVNDLSTLGKPYRLLHAISTLIVATPAELAKQSHDFDSPVSPYIILLMLFGYAGSDLTSPHLAASWTQEKLIQWLDGHTAEKERLELITGALQKYRTIVRQKNIAQYDTVYPFISQYLEKAYKNV